MSERSQYGFLSQAALGALAFFIISYVLLLLPPVAHAATYTFSPASGTYEVGASFSVRLIINTEGKSVIGLVGGGSLSYDTAKLTLTNIAFVDFNLPVTEPKVGTPPIKFDGGKIGNSSGNVTVLNATFRAKAEGSATVSLSDPQILEAGSSILSGSAPSATFTITPASTAPEPPTPEKETRTVNIPPPEPPTARTAIEGWGPDRPDYRGGRGAALIR
jgi:hypothetical protein